jgi:hypothetical protein
MNNKGKQINIFFAIPCGEFFSIQNQCIKTVCKAAGVNLIIVEDHTKTAGLWEKIAEKIDFADYFVADISSLSANIILELGYSIREKKSKYNAIFIADNIQVPVDLQGFTLQKYTSISDFQGKLIKWLCDNIPFVNSNKLMSLDTKSLEFYEDFKDYNRFFKLWSFPPQSSFQLTHEGLRFTNAHFPIMTTHLGLLKNYEFEFKAKIESLNLGWIIKGTRPFNNYLPTFCIMFNINQKGVLRPHIFNSNKVVINPPTHYRVFDEQQVQFIISNEGWFTIITRIIGDKITIFNDGNIVFDQDFSVDPYKEFYEFPNKQGEVGFRCHPGEQGIINYLKVREIETELHKTTSDIL